MYQDAAEFFDEHGGHGKADRERELADHEARDAETDPREPVAGMKSHHQIRSYRHDPARSKRSRPIRVWLAAQDGHRTCRLLYPAAVPGFRFSGECPGLSWGGALMPLLPRLDRVADLRFSPPEVLSHTALRASDYHFPYGGVGIVDLQKLKPTVPVFGHRSPAKDRVAG
jgi:hypothetical protein